MLDRGTAKKHASGDRLDAEWGEREHLPFFREGERVQSLETIGRSIVDNLDEVVRGWPKTTEAEPWLKLPAALDLDHIPETLQALVDAALLEPQSQEARLRLVRNAARHGQHRKEQGHSQHLIFLEHHLMRRVLGRYVWEVSPASLARFEAIARLDVAITLSATAALRAYHREQLEAAGQWPQGIDRLARDWVPPWD